MTFLQQTKGTIYDSKEKLYLAQLCLSTYVVCNASNTYMIT